jgi:cold shock CspA family protein
MSSRINGIVVRVNAERGFAFVQTEDSNVFVHAKAAGQKWEYIVERASVTLEYTHSYNDKAKTDADRYRMTATKVFSVEAPAEIEEFELLTQVAFFDKEKGYGRVVCGESFSKPLAYLSSKVCREAGIEPGKGMPVRATVIEDLKGPLVTSFEWGPAIDKEYAEKHAAVELETKKDTATGEAPMKHFNHKKQFGHIIVDGADLFFHVNGMKDKNLKKRFQKGEIPNGSILGYKVGQFKGKSVALITSVVSLAEVVSEAAEESVAGETAEAPAEVVAETKVEIAPEAEAPAKPKPKRKPTTRNPEAKAKPTNKSAVPKGKVRRVKGGDIPKASDYGNLEGLGWNTVEMLVKKWNKVFNEIALSNENQENPLVTSNYS